MSAVVGLGFLIDECLHASLADLANERGFVAYHVDRLGLKGTPDWQLFQRAQDQGLTLVTNNCMDFRKLCARSSLHFGVILVLPMVRPSLQAALFGAVLGTVVERPDLLNTVIEVDLAGDAILLREFAMPPS